MNKESRKKNVLVIYSNVLKNIRIDFAYIYKLLYNVNEGDPIAAYAALQ